MVTELLSGITVEPNLGVWFDIVSMPPAVFDLSAPTAADVARLLEVTPWGTNLAPDAIPPALAALLFDAVTPGRGVGADVFGGLMSGTGPWLERLAWAEWPFPREVLDVDVEAAMREFVAETASGSHVVFRGSPPRETSLDAAVARSVAAGIGAGGVILGASHVTGAALLIVGGPVILVCGAAGGAVFAATRYVARRMSQS